MHQTTRAEHEPRVLEDPDLIAAIQRQTIGGRLLAALPMFREDARTARRSRAGSVLRENLRAWLVSEDGASWKAQRAALFCPAAVFDEQDDVDDDDLL